MTDEQITELYGERCPDHEPSCACCVVWDMRDHIEAQAKEIAETRAANDRCEELFKQMQAEAEAQAKEIAELKAALAASREQCAKVANEWMRDYAADACCDGAQAEAAFEIAAAIRSMS